MKKTFKGFIMGVVIATLLMSTVLGASAKETIEVVFNSINLSVNGKKVEADNILYKGTTYVPLRATGDMLGKSVGWDEKTRTASIDDKGKETVVEEKKPETNAGESLSQKNAVKKAESYLSYSAFSKEGLIKQLEFEGFSKADSTYAVNKLNVDWNEQAVKKAESYLDYSSFSRSGLIKQLEFEGFTNAQATHAVDKIGL